MQPIQIPGPRLPLGVRREMRYESASMPLPEGERVLFLTDGLPEALTKDDEPLGYEELATLIDRLLERLAEATAEGQQDDITTLLLESGSET